MNPWLENRVAFSHRETAGWSLWSVCVDNKLNNLSISTKYNLVTFEHFLAKSISVMAFLRTVLRCSLSRKYGLNFSNNSLRNGRINVNLNQLALKSTATNLPSSTPVSPKDPLDITFEDAKAAFKSKTTWELYRAYIVYTLCSVEYLVENNMKVGILN